jgi:hypothetical protein
MAEGTRCQVSGHEESIDAIAEQFKTDLDSGLTAAAVAYRYETYGRNELPVKLGKPFRLRFLLQFHQPLLYMLLLAGALVPCIEPERSITRLKFRGVRSVFSWMVGGVMRTSTSRVMGLSGHECPMEGDEFNGGLSRVSLGHGGFLREELRSMSRWAMSCGSRSRSWAIAMPPVLESETETPGRDSPPQR